MPVLVMTDGAISDRLNHLFSFDRSWWIVNVNRHEVGKFQLGKREKREKNEMQFPCHSQLNQ